MTFGQLKTIYESYLTKSYNNKNKFKLVLKEFKEDILENKSLTKLYSLYDDLSNPQGLTESDANQFLVDGISLIQNILKTTKISNYKLEESYNDYKEIDSLVYENHNVGLSDRLESRKKIIQTLCSPKKGVTESVKIPLSSMLNIANSNLTTFMKNLDETSKKEIISLLSEDKKTSEKNFQDLKNNTIKKLSLLTLTEDESNKVKIEETINKINNEKYDLINFYRLKKLNESL